MYVQLTGWGNALSAQGPGLKPYHQNKAKLVLNFTPMFSFHNDCLSKHL